MEQIERTRRYLERVRQIYRGVPYMDRNADHYGDDVVSFFVHCHHIRDWVLALNLLGINHREVEAFVNQHQELGICADLCNGAKHCELTRRTRSGDEPHVCVTTFESSLRLDGRHTTKGEFQIMSNGELYDALELAETCIRLWDGYVTNLRRLARCRRRPDDSGQGA